MCFARELCALSGGQMKRFKYNNAIHKIALSAIVASFAGVVACDDVYWDREAYDGFIDTFGVKHPSQFDLNNNVCAYIARESMGIEKLNGSNWQNAIAEYHTQHPNDPIAPECLAQGDSNIAASAPDENGDSTDTQPSNSSENLALYKDPDFLKCLRAQIEIIQSRCDAVSVSKTGDENEGRMYIQVAEDITSKAQLDATIFACAQNDKNKDKNVCSDTATTQEHRNILNYRQCPNGYSLVVDGDKADRTYVCARTVCKSVAVHFETDMLNCGVCGNACDATENCSAGTCVPAECPKGQERCNNVCVNLASVHIADCNGDTITCNDGFKQCDENKVACNDLNQDIENCGTCGNRCKDGEACFRGECRINTCESQNETLCDINGDAQCKNIASDDADHCGACNYKCSSYPIPNATSNSCSAGQCQYECTDPYTNIADKADASGIQCVDFMTDSNHCGKKNNVCKDGNVCIGGHCKANPCTNPLETACLVGEENKCFNINATNKDHCGACNYKCSDHNVTNATSDACYDGECQYTCNTGFVNVGGGATADTIKCINPRTDYNHCGASSATSRGDDCARYPGKSCKDGTCACPDGQTYCDRKCVVLSSVNIDSCSDDKITCKSGFDRCDKTKVACQDLNQDKEHCGKCSTKCNKDESCYNGQCVVNECANGQTLCDVEGKAECRYTMSEDAAHCGACNYVCSAHPLKNAKSNSCIDGQCQYVCDDNFTNIGGATASTINCVDFMTDSNHCGKKDNVCKDGNVCIGGHCKANPCTNSSETACLVGEENKCFNINATNKDHCGACNYKCSEHKVTNATSDVCKAGKCQYTCNTGFVNVGGGATADTIKCIDPRNDYNHCGKLDANTYEDCSKNPGTKCVDGVCTLNCPTGQQDCGTHCLNFTELNIDKCNNGTLVCLKDFENVDGKVENGCEVNLKTDSNNCGIKGKKCENGYCNNGTCQTTNCPQNELPCGENGACENVVNNVNHCGYCGNTCSGTTSVCSNRKCVECVDDGQCSGDKKRCNNLSGICQECLISDHCEIQNSLYVSCEVGSCNLIACKSGFHKSEDGKSCAEDSPKACGSTISDCTEIANSNEVACNAGNCEVKTCSGDNHVSADKKSCVQNSKEACGSATNDCTTIANSNEVACNAGNCEVKSCTGDNHVSADKKTCEADTIKACGPKIDDCTKVITGNVDGVICQGGECKVSTCKEGYEVNGDQTECVEKATSGTDPGNGGDGSGSGSEGTGSGADGGTGGTGTGDNGGTESP